MSYEFEYDDLEYDRGYGIENGTLQVEVSPVFTDERFDAHGPGGTLQLFGDARALTDFTIEDAVIFFIDQDGGEYGEMSLDTEDVLKLVDHDTILQDLINKHY